MASKFDTPRNARFRARLPVRKNGVFSHYSKVTYYFDENMKEIGFKVDSGRFIYAQRDWEPDHLAEYFIQNIKTNEVVQEGRK